MRRETEGEAGRADATLPVRVLRVLRRIVGAPDYQAYVEHCQAAGHPLRLSEREYVAEFFAAKGKGVRCC